MRYKNLAEVYAADVLHITLWKTDDNNEKNNKKNNEK